MMRKLFKSNLQNLLKS